MSVGLLFVVFPSLLLAQESKQFQAFQKTQAFVRMLERSHAASFHVILAYFFSRRDSRIRTAEIEKVEKQIRKDSSLVQPNIENLSLNSEVKELIGEAQAMRYTTIALIDELKDAAKTPSDDQRQYQMAMMTVPLSADLQTFHAKLFTLHNTIQKEGPEHIKRKEELFLLVFVGLASGTAISFAAMWLFTRDVVSRLNAIAETTSLIAIGQRVEPPPPRTDEIGELERQIYQASLTIDETRKRETAILNGGTHVICTLDSRMRIILIGETCNKIWNYPSDELLGKSAMSIMHKDSVDPARTALEQLKSERDREAEIDIRIVLGDGTIRDTLWSVSWSAAKGSFYCIVRDVTELRRIEKLRQYFLSMAGHDLRSPLTAINVSLNLVSEGLRGPVPARLAVELSKMEGTTNRLIDFVNQLLEIEKLEAGIGSLEPGAVSAADVCESAIESLQSLLAQYQVKVKGPAGTALLLADEAKLERAVVNLLASAIKLGAPSEELVLSVLQQSDFGFIKVTVPGLRLPAHMNEQIFEKLRLSTALPDSQNAGLGLAIVKVIADMHQGRVGIEPDGSSGSTLWLAIPTFDRETQE